MDAYRVWDDGSHCSHGQHSSVCYPYETDTYPVHCRQDLIVEMYRGYHAFSVSGPKGGTLPNPSAFYANAATPESLVKNSITVSLAIISDVIIVYRTFIVWNFNYLVVLIPIGLLFGDIGTQTAASVATVRSGLTCTPSTTPSPPLPPPAHAHTALGIWSTWTLSRTKVGDVLILADVSVRVKYFFVITFVLNALCASLICWKIWRINSRVSQAASSDRTTSRVFEVVIETGTYRLLLCWYPGPVLMSTLRGSCAVLCAPLHSHSDG